ncbi:MAG: deoxyribonuclease IV [Clostridia bacterium]|nr:deoxyribonuclease IV [Clostridia bacterium]
MLNIGCHLSSSNGFVAMAQNAISIGANTFQYFTRNPRGGRAKEIDHDDLKKFLEIGKNNNFTSIIAHAPYTMNLCSSDKKIRIYSKNLLKDDIEKTELIPNVYYNLHPGSHTGQGVKTGINQISASINEIITKSQNTILLLETMAGKGSEIGGNFEEIAAIINQINIKEKIGVCFDTCHVYDSGYDIVNNLENVLEKFDKIIGISKLKVVHLNDSKNICGSKKDRHEKIGQGNIGLNGIINIIKNKYLRNLIFILETPQENLNGYKDEISNIKNHLN